MTQGGKAFTAGASKACTVRTVLVLLLSTFLSAAWGANVLIMNGVPGSEFGGADQHRLKATTDLQAALTNAGHAVTVSNFIPENLSQYAQIWDIDFAHAIPDAAIKQYANYVQDSQKRLYVIGENSAFVARNNSILVLIGAVTGVTHTFAVPPVDPDTGNRYTQTVLPPFTGPNSIGGNDVTYLAPGGITSAGKGQFITVDSGSGIGTAAIFGNLVVVFDTGIAESDVDVPDMQALLNNLIGHVPVATLASGLNFPFGVAVDPRPGNGTVYIADRNSHKVWSIDSGASAPALTLVAGTGEAGYNGDGIIAIEAQLDSPTGVAVDTEGTLFIADSGNHIIRKISAPGTAGALIFTAAGTPQTPGAAVDGVPATRAVCDAGPDPALCVPAKLFGPRGVAVGDSAGKFFVADTMNQQVRAVDGDGIIHTVAGVVGETGANDGPVSCLPADTECVPARLNSPLGVAIDVSNTITTGIVYIADEGNNVIRKVVAGFVTTESASVLDSPSGVAVDLGGDLYIADVDNHRIQRVSAGTATTVLGTGLNSPVSVAVGPNGDLYVADLLNHRILKVVLAPPPPPIN